MTGRLGKRYARALFELARADDTLEATAEELGRAVAAFEEPRLQPLLLSPAIDSRVRQRTCREVVAALKLSRNLGNLWLLLAERARLPVLPDVARWFDAFVDEALGRARVTIRSAAPLSTAERSELTELARRLTRQKEVLAAIEVEPDLLGGVVLDVGGTVYDGSVRAQLERLSKEMAEGGV